jgi:hypothetical protein
MLYLSQTVFGHSDDSVGHIMHEGCHNLMNFMMGGLRGMSSDDVEGPCVRMSYLYQFNDGGIRAYDDLVKRVSPTSLRHRVRPRRQADVRLLFQDEAHGGGSQ